MSTILLLMIPTLGALIGVLTIQLGKFWVLRQTQTEEFSASLTRIILENVKPKEMIADGVAALNLTEELEVLLDPQLDKLVTAFRSQIPMASMLLTSTLAEKLKGIARQEILKMLPEIEQKMIERIGKKDFEKLVKEKIVALDWRKLEKENASILTRASIAAGLLGGSIGLIQLLIASIAYKI